MNNFSGVPFYEIYDRLDAERNGSIYDDGEDFSHIAAWMQSLEPRVSGRQQECVGENALQ